MGAQVERGHVRVVHELLLAGAGTLVMNRVQYAHRRAACPRIYMVLYRARNTVIGVAYKEKHPKVAERERKEVNEVSYTFGYNGNRTIPI